MTDTPYAVPGRAQRRRRGSNRANVLRGRGGAAPKPTRATSPGLASAPARAGHDRRHAIEALTHWFFALRARRHRLGGSADAVRPDAHPPAASSHLAVSISGGADTANADGRPLRARRRGRDRRQAGHALGSRRRNARPGRRTTSRTSSSTAPTTRGCSRRTRRSGDRAAPVASPDRGRRRRRHHVRRAPRRLPAPSADPQPRGDGNRAAEPRGPLGLGLRAGRRRSGGKPARRRAVRPPGAREQPDRRAHGGCTPTPATARASCPPTRPGRAAGMGASTVSATLELAWTFDAQGDVLPAQGITLPVYHSWTFATGPDGDFASLARRLHAVKHASRARRARHGRDRTRRRAAVRPAPASAACRAR